MKLILLDDNRDNKLLNYIMHKLPDMIVRSRLNISKHNKDPIKRTNTSKLLNDAVDIIVNNKGTTITNDDKLIKNIREYIIPYFVEYFDAYISESQNIVNKYLHHISTISRDMEIYTLIKARSDEEH
jgi:DTW domain-containing protein YfiP